VLERLFKVKYPKPTLLINFNLLLISLSILFDNSTSYLDKFNLIKNDCNSLIGIWTRSVIDFPFIFT
jgi:hypothetical protein